MLLLWKDSLNVKMITIEENDQRFYIAESTIENAGRGVFAKHSIPKGSHLEIIGVRVKSGSVSNTCTAYANSYKFASSSDLEHFIVPMGYGGIVNHAPSKEDQNVELRHVDSKTVYYFLQDVEADEEILGNYGENWTSVLDWASEKANLLQDDWTTFLRFDLYNLGKLAATIDKE